MFKDPYLDEVLWCRPRLDRFLILKSIDRMIVDGGLRA